MKKKIKQAQDEWNVWSAIEESFYSQKSRIIWLKESDANTKFFHNSVKSNLSRNTIHYLRDSNNIKVTDPIQIKLMVEQFYFNLLGITNSDVTPYSVEHIKSLHSFWYNSDLAARLTTNPTSSEVKTALLALPKNKAHGPDDFSDEFLSFLGILLAQSSQQQ